VRARGVGFAVLAVALLAVPVLLSDSYFVHVMIVALIFAMLASGLDLVMGYCGQFSFGQAAFYGIGAYTSALLALKAGWPFWAALPAAATVLVKGSRFMRMERVVAALTGEAQGGH